MVVDLSITYNLDTYIESQSGLTSKGCVYPLVGKNLDDIINNS